MSSKMVMEFDREPFINAFNVLRRALIRDEAVQKMVDTLLRAMSIPLIHGAQIAVLLLNGNASDLLCALLVRIGEGLPPRVPDGIESIQTIDLNLSYEGKTLRDAIKAETKREAARIASKIIQNKYGELWTTIIVDMQRIKELFDIIYPASVTEDLLRKVVKMTVDKCSADEIIFEPVPGILETLRKIF
jgi:hypothetical protein